MVELENGKKAVIMEAGLSNYPGMFLTANPQMPHGVKAEFAPIHRKQSSEAMTA